MNSLKLFIAAIALVGSQLVHAGELPCGARTDDGPMAPVAAKKTVLPAFRKVASKAAAAAPVKKSGKLKGTY